MLSKWFNSIKFQESIQTIPVNQSTVMELTTLTISLLIHFISGFGVLFQWHSFLQENLQSRGRENEVCYWSNPCYQKETLKEDNIATCIVLRCLIFWIIITLSDEMTKMSFSEFERPKVFPNKIFWSTKNLFKFLVVSRNIFRQGFCFFYFNKLKEQG